MPAALLAARDTASIAQAFHAEHNRLYGYSLAQEATPIEIINVRVQAVGLTTKPTYREQPWSGTGSAHAIKGERAVYIPETRAFARVAVYDGHQLAHGNRVQGPAMIEQETTAIFVSNSYDCVVDALGSFALYAKGREDLVASCFKEEATA